MADNQKIAVLLVDDHKMVRAGMKQLLLSCEKLNCVVDEAESGIEAIRKCTLKKFDIVFMDMKMPDMDGIETTRKIMKIRKQNIIGLSMHTEIYFANNLLDAGGRGYLIKNAGTEELTNAIQTVLSGELWISNEVSVKMIRNLREAAKKKPIESRKGIYEKLSGREKQILEMIVNDNTSESISKKLKLSRRTVETHRRNIMTKFNVTTAAGLVRCAIEAKIIPLRGLPF